MNRGGPQGEALFRLSPSLDPAALQRRFADDGRIEIADFIDPAAALALREHLLARTDWVLVLNAGEKVFEIPRDKLAELSPDQLDQLDANVVREARGGFQFRFETIRVPDEPQERDDSLLDSFVEFLSSEQVLGLFRTIVGSDAIDFADGQATAYSPGHFLTAHDDAIESKNRKAAYVFGLTPDWRPEWGGLLMFHRDNAAIDEVYAPTMAALRLFRVPVRHSVSYVAPFAPEPRLSVTGWLRGR